MSLSLKLPSPHKAQSILGASLGMVPTSALGSSGPTQTHPPPWFAGCVELLQQLGRTSHAPSSEENSLPRWRKTVFQPVSGRSLGNHHQDRPGLGDQGKSQNTSWETFCTSRALEARMWPRMLFILWESKRMSSTRSFFFET